MKRDESPQHHRYTGLGILGYLRLTKSSRLGDEEKLVLASDAMLWNDDSSDRLDLARQTVLAYIRDIETDFEADPR